MKYHVYKPVDSDNTKGVCVFPLQIAYLYHIILCYILLLCHNDDRFVVLLILLLYKQEHNIVCDNDNLFSQANIMRHRISKCRRGDLNKIVILPGGAARGWGKRSRILS